MSLLRLVQPGPVINFHFLPNFSLSLSHTRGMFSLQKSYMTPICIPKPQTFLNFRYIKRLYEVGSIYLQTLPKSACASMLEGPHLLPILTAIFYKQLSSPAFLLIFPFPLSTVPRSALTVATFLSLQHSFQSKKYRRSPSSFTTPNTLQPSSPSRQDPKPGLSPTTSFQKSH